MEPSTDQISNKKNSIAFYDILYCITTEVSQVGFIRCLKPSLQTKYAECVISARVSFKQFRDTEIGCDVTTCICNAI